jgi:hypothetical protein
MHQILQDLEAHPESNLNEVTARLEDDIVILNPSFTEKGIVYGCIHALADNAFISKEDTGRILEKDKWTLTDTGEQAIVDNQILIETAEAPLKIKYIFFNHLKQNEIEHLIILYLKFHGAANNGALTDFIDLFMFGSNNCTQGRAQVGRGVTGVRDRGWVNAERNQPRTLTQAGIDYLNELDSPYEFGPFKIHFNHDNAQYEVETFIPNVHQFEPVIPPVPEVENNVENNIEQEPPLDNPPEDTDYLVRHPDAINLG